ncbi:MAG: PucR family transcriptional regulator [Pseudonocardia sp.]
MRRSGAAAAAAPRAVPAQRRENLALRELVAVYSHLSGLASQDADVDGVVRLVAHRTGAAVAVLGPGPDVVAAVPADAAERLRHATGAQLPQVLAAAARTRRPMAVPALAATSERPPMVVVAPILVGDDVAAHLVTVGAARDPGQDDELDDDLGLLLTEHAATICGIILGRERVVAAAAGRARTDLIEGLLLARDRVDGGEAERWAGHLGFARGTVHHVLAVAAVGDGEPVVRDRARVLGLAEQALHRRLAGAIVAVRDTEVVAVVPAGEGLDGVRALGRHCLAALEARFPDIPVVVGVGGGCALPTEIARSYAQARGAIDAATRMGRGAEVVAFDDLGIHRLLFQIPDLGELREFAADVLGGLDTQPDLLTTLTVWFRCNGSPQRTARELHVHPNTVTYRVRRIEEVTGLALAHSRDGLMAQVAC